ncbi:unnamed protein product [Lactuca virosa]|uniref:HTH myb-type domain-containing protein n=1 Tax=Lactuca virosa TaxID=75947 RepID=A0AAU9MEX2_9ASTR|nr:unnamed protein product [Lactuca virosa]
MNLQAILMSKEDDDQTLLKALKDGALLVLKRPLTGDRIRLLRQHVIRKRIQNLNNPNIIDKFRRVENLGIPNITYNFSHVPNIRNVNVANAFPWVMKKEPIMYDGDATTCKSVCSKRKSKMRLVWTPELHEKFMDAIGQLGEGRCIPKLIHEQMGVPGITRAQVSSHLQATQRKMENRKA